MQKVKHVFVIAGLATICAMVCPPTVKAIDLNSPPDGPTMVELPGHIPHHAIGHSRKQGRVSASRKVSLALVLPLRNPTALDALITKLHDPANPIYGHYLTPQQFNEQFAPSQADSDAAAAFARAHGLTVTGASANRVFLTVHGTVKTVEEAFNLHLMHFKNADGRLFFAPDGEPKVPSEFASKLAGVIGLDTAKDWRPHFRRVPQNEKGRTGAGPQGGYTPAEINGAYNTAGIPATGAGQTLGLFELDGYDPKDIEAYETQYGLPKVPLQNVLLDGYDGSAGDGAGEVTSDIEMMIALAPGTAKILVYEAPNSDSGVIDCYSRIASDNLAKSVSTSWGSPEQASNVAFANAEATVFKQMAAQGQSIFAAAGDSGAYDDGKNLCVDDPASQPYVCGVGGTHLNLTNGGYGTETTWSHTDVSDGAGGGGISTTWPIPSYQQGLTSVDPSVSTTARNVPDVSLNADLDSGYSIYLSGEWTVIGGTSLAAPLWAALMGRVNEARATHSLGTIGFVNPQLYQIARTPRYDADFHDIADNSTNLFYHAVKGYDCATGLGSFNAVNLFGDLSVATASPGTPPSH